jgi:serine protease AprX
MDRRAGHCGEERASALWGSSTRGGGHRSSAIWGKNGRRTAIAALLVLVLALPTIATAASKGGPPPAATPTTPTTPALKTTIVGGPDNLDTVFGDVTFTFTANRPAAFQCSVDDAAFAACSSAASHTVIGAATGLHTFRVRAVDPTGAVEQSPATASWFRGYTNNVTYPAGSLLARAKANPTQLFSVIVELVASDAVEKVHSFAKAKATDGGRANGKTKGNRARVGSAFTSINGFPATLPGWSLLLMSDTDPSILAITEDLPVKLTDFTPAQVWPTAVGADKLWARDPIACAIDAIRGKIDKKCNPSGGYTPPAAPTIAVIDSGIDDEAVSDFGSRVLEHVNLGKDGGARDDYGHGTLVAGIAAGASKIYPGVAPTANLVDVRVINADGSAATSDVIEAADWILQHKDEYGIKVANFSLHSGKPNTIKYDPLDHAVERLWFSGVTVVAAAGNFGDGKPQTMPFAPANDPFVITVGAADTHDTVPTSDDDIAYWSSYGYTPDGFAKPELSAPGRYMIGPMAPTAALAVERADHVVAPGYIQLSGTSFAAPVVSGAAAQILAFHPSWSPGQVKGALMMKARPLRVPNTLQDGVGEIDVAGSAGLRSAQNANKALDKFVVASPSGIVFDYASWASVARANASWADASWADASWADASWAEASWADASWASASWADASWADAAFASASWADAASVD